MVLLNDFQVDSAIMIPMFSIYFNLVLLVGEHKKYLKSNYLQFKCQNKVLCKVFTESIFSVSNYNVCTNENKFN